MIIDHTHPKYRQVWENLGDDRYNGAYYYSLEIVSNIIPNVLTDRSWVTINIEGEARHRAIVFIHNNLEPQIYDWLKGYEDLILVCGVPETVKKVQHLGTAIYLPLSVNVAEVKRYRKKKDRYLAYAGRPSKARSVFPPETEFLEGLPRKELLREMARFEYVYAVGRTAIEAKILGCEVLSYDARYPDPEVWEIVDSKDAAKMLQEKLIAIDGRLEMKKYKVLKPYTDLETDRSVWEGETVELSTKRAKAMIEEGFVEEIKEKKKEKKDGK